MGFFFKTKAKVAPAKDNVEMSTIASKQEKPVVNSSSILSDSYLLKIMEDEHYFLGYKCAPASESFGIILYNKKLDTVIQKNWPVSDKKRINYFSHAISSTGWLSITLDTYFSESPHTERNTFLFDVAGKEVLYFHYEKNGARNYKFSESGRYYILMNENAFHIYDTEMNQLKTFYPENLESSEARDFIIFENQRNIAYQYTQHPDKPFYHFTFDGELIEKGAFQAQIEKTYEASEETKAFYALFDELHNASRPLSAEDYERFSNAMLSYSQNPEHEYAWLYREMGELELEMDHKEKALSYFEKALDMDPKVGVKRLAAKLSKELNKPA